MPSLTPEDLKHIAERTLAHYEHNAQSFWEGTRNHDVSQNIQALLKHIQTPPPWPAPTAAATCSNKASFFNSI